MNSIAWKWIVTANCLLAASASFGADRYVGKQSGHQSKSPSYISNPIAHATHKLHKPLTMDSSKFHYMDSAPIYNTHHVRAAVMVFEKKNNKQNECASMTGKAKHHCYELAMPT